MEKLTYGLLNDNLIHIDDVEKGLACNCLCPHCKGQLIARKGNKNIKHFAHYKLADCNHGTETALHLMAKSIIERTRRIFVPFVPKTEYDFSKRGKIITFNKAILEKPLSNNIRGDVVLYNGESYLNVEIKVTHEVDLTKTIELFNLGIPTLEIDLSNIKDNFTPELIEQILLSGQNTTLLCSPKRKDIFAKIILGEWKKVHNYEYVKDCPFSRTKAYFEDYNGKGGPYECHECYSYVNYDGNGKYYLCWGRLGNVDFSQIDQIIHLEKEENHLVYVNLLMKDGSNIEIGKTNKLNNSF